MKLVEQTTADKIANPMIAKAIADICGLRDQIRIAVDWRSQSYFHPVLDAAVAEVRLVTGLPDCEARNWILQDFVTRREDEIQILNARIKGLEQTRDVASGRLPVPNFTGTGKRRRGRT